VFEPNKLFIGECGSAGPDFLLQVLCWHQERACEPVHRLFRFGFLAFADQGVRKFVRQGKPVAFNVDVAAYHDAYGWLLRWSLHMAGQPIKSVVTVDLNNPHVPFLQQRGHAGDRVSA